MDRFAQRLHSKNETISMYLHRESFRNGQNEGESFSFLSILLLNYFVQKFLKIDMCRWEEATTSSHFGEISVSQAASVPQIDGLGTSVISGTQKIVSYHVQIWAHLPLSVLLSRI